MRLFVFLATLLISGGAHAQCVGALQSANNLSDVCSSSTAVNNILPSQGGNSGKVLQTNGSAASWQTPATGSVTSVSAGAGMDFSTITATGSVAASADVRLTELVFFISGGGSAISSSSCVWNGTAAGSKMCMLDVGFACTIVGAGIKAHPSGSVSFDVASTTYSNFDGGSTHPASGDKISASAPVAVSSSTKNIDTTLTGWTTSISGTVAAPVTVALQVNGTPSTVEEAVVTLYCRRP